MCKRCGLNISHIVSLGIKRLYDEALKWYRTYGLVLIRYFNLWGKYRNLSVEYVIHAPCSSAATNPDLALFAREIASGLLEWSYWIPSLNAVYNHCYGSAIENILAKHGENTWNSILNQARKSLLASRYSISAIENLKPSTRIILKITLWRKFIDITRMKEIAIIRSLTCPKCFQGDLKVINRNQLQNGDEVIAKCEACGEEIKVIFNFKQPEDCDSIINDIVFLVLDNLYVASSKDSSVSFTNSLRDLLNIIRLDPKLFRQALRAIAKCATNLHMWINKVPPRVYREELIKIYSSWLRLLLVGLKSYLGEKDLSEILMTLENELKGKGQSSRVLLSNSLEEDVEEEILKNLVKW